MKKILFLFLMLICIGASAQITFTTNCPSIEVYDGGEIVRTFHAESLVFAKSNTGDFVLRDAVGSQTFYLTDIAAFSTLNEARTFFTSTIDTCASVTVNISSDYTTEVSLGNVTGSTIWNKFGYNDDVDLAAPEVLAEFGGTFQYVKVGETLDIVSTSANDDVDSTGVTQLVIYGVDSLWDAVTEVISLDGVNSVTTTNKYVGVNKMTIFNSGSADSNVGDITATFTTAGYTAAKMPAGQGTTQQCIFYVPRNSQFNATWLYLTAIKSSGVVNPIANFTGYVYSAVADSEFEIFRGEIDTGISNVKDLSPPEPFVVGEKSVLWFEASTSSDNTKVRGRFSGKLISTQ